MKKIPFWENSMGEEEKKLVNEVLDSGYINEGEVTKKFEDRVSELLNVKCAIATTSGTVALFLAMKGLGIGYGDEVIVPNVTWIGSANAVDLTGAKPVLVDIDSKTLNISVNSFKKAINDKTKAVMPVHICGRSADMENIMLIAKENNLFVVEDAAEAFMSKSNLGYLGTIGDVGIFSFSYNKAVTTGQGGMVITNNLDLGNKIRELKNQGLAFRGTAANDLYNSIGYNFRMTNLQAAVGNGQLSRFLDFRMEKMKRNYRIYKRELGNLDEVTFLGFDIENGEVPLWVDILVDNRDDFYNFLEKARIYCRKFWYPINIQKPYFLPDTKFPNSSKIMSKAIWLPSSFEMTDEDILIVCKCIKEYFANE